MEGVTFVASSVSLALLSVVGGASSMGDVRGGACVTAGLFMHPHHRFAFEIDKQSVELVDYLLGVHLHFLNLLFSGRERLSLPGRELVGLEIRITGKNPLHVGDDLIVSRLEAFICSDELAMFVQLRRARKASP